MKKFIRNSMYALGIVLLVSLVFGWAMSKIYQRSTIFKPMVILNFNEKPTHIILGSSRALTTLNTKKINESRNKKGELWYNLSMDDSSPEIHLLLIQMLIENKIYPEKIYLQYDRTHSPENIHEWQDNDYRFIPMVHSSDAVSSYISEKQNAFYVKYFSLGTYAYYNTELIYPALLALKEPTYTHRFDQFGDVTYPNSKKMTWNGQRKEGKLNEVDPTLIRIKSLCKQYNIQLQLFVAPYLSKSVQVSDHSILNYSDVFLDETYFYDHQHINQRGKDELTKLFIHSLP